jgi:hypothetical protein
MRTARRLYESGIALSLLVPVFLALWTLLPVPPAWAVASAPRRLRERPVSESGRLRHGEGTRGWGARRRRALMLTILYAMTDAELRRRIRDLMSSGVLPGEPAPIQRKVPPAPQGHRNQRMFVGDSLLKEACTICGKLAPEIQHFYSAGLVVRVHALCDAVWKQERDAPTS